MSEISRLNELEKQGKTIVMSIVGIILTFALITFIFGDSNTRAFILLAMALNLMNGAKWAKWLWAVLAVLTTVVSAAIIVTYMDLFEWLDYLLIIPELLFVIISSIILFISKPANAYTEAVRRQRRVRRSPERKDEEDV
ncbi:MAG: hypothetical protein FWE21_04410 [Defluviitaleaceae bacterium]|nr:hypothetical protein [Defluviitaleaceae bacterium]